MFILNRHTIAAIGIVAVLFVKTSTAQTGPLTELPASYNADATLTIENSPYVARNTVVVFPGATLTFESGVYIYFEENVQLRILGGLITEIGGPRTRLTSLNGGDLWSGIFLDESLASSIRRVHFSSGSPCLKVKDDLDPTFPVVQDNTFENCETGIFVEGDRDGRFEIKNNRFESSATGIETFEARPTISGNLILNSNFGINVRAGTCGGGNLCNDVSPDVNSNLIVGATSHSIIAGNSAPSISGNTFQNASPTNATITVSRFSPNITDNNFALLSVPLRLQIGEANVQAINNWWGTTQDQEIGALITDVFDDPNLGFATYAPFLLAESPTAARQLVLNVRASQQSDDGIQVEWDAHRGTDLTGYRVYLWKTEEDVALSDASVQDAGLSKTAHINGLDLSFATTVAVTNYGASGLDSWAAIATVNRSPIVSIGIQDFSIRLGQSPTSIDLLGTFSDPDDEPLLFTATSSNNGIATATVVGSSLTLHSVSQGQASIAVTANDGISISGTTQFLLSVLPSNSPLVSATIPPVELIIGEADFSTDLSAIFSDPDSDPLTFTASSSSDGVATASMANSMLTVHAVSKGDATITATANDGFGGETETTFDVNVPTGIGSERLSDEVPTSYALHQNYPNPFNPVTTINFDLPEPSHVLLTVYDVMGRELEVLVDETLPAGVHSASFDAASLPSGTYLYKLETPQGVFSKGMILLK